MKTFLIPTCLVFLLIGAIAFWYFGHQHSAQEILKDEPKNVYLGTVPAQDTSPVELSSDETSTQVHQDEIDMESPTAMEDMTTDSSLESTNTKVHGQHAVSSNVAVSNEGSVTSSDSEQPVLQYCQADPEAAAKREAEQLRLEAAQLKLALAEAHLKATKSKHEPKIISHVNRLNAMSPEEQHKHWEDYRTFLANYVVPNLPDEDKFDPDEVIQMFRDGLIKYGYQQQY